MMKLVLQKSGDGMYFYADGRLVGTVKAAPGARDRFLLLDEHTVGSITESTSGW